MLTSEVALGVVLTLLAAANVTRPAVPASTVQIVVIGKAPTPSVRATVYSADWCGPCRSYIGGTPEHNKGIKDVMPPDGWIVKGENEKDVESAHIVITKSQNDWTRERITQLPCTIIRKNGIEKKRFVGKLTPDQLANAINDVAKKDD